MNVTTMEDLYLEFRDEGQLSQGNIDELSITLRDEYFFRGGKGDAGDVEMWFYQALTEGELEGEL